MVNQYLDPNTLDPKDLENLNIIGENHLEYFAFLPRKLGFYVKEMIGVTVINCGLKTSMFNIAYGSPQTLEISDAINEIKNAFLGQPFAWWVPATHHNPKVTTTLLQSGFTVETAEHAMICNLDMNTNFQKTTDLEIKPLTDKRALEDFLKILEVYDPYVGKFYTRMNEELFNAEAAFCWICR